MDVGLISVDRWTGWSQAYFLTHMHADHTQGLCPTWSRGPLFCSPVTAKLFPVKFPGFDLTLLRVIPMASWVSLSLSRTVVEVMALDAQHCPGSVMFLFRGEFGCLLYTGDFRWEACNERATETRAMLLNILRDNPVDILYLDNTYCNPMYDFPSRQVAAQQVANIVASHPEHDIIIGIDSLGKEELLLHISRTLDLKIWVWPERLQMMHLLGFDDMFTTNTTLTRVRAVPRYSFSIDTLEGLNHMRPTLGIMPSGLPWVINPLKRNDDLFRSGLVQNDKVNRNLHGVHKYHKYIYSVQYSDHSCFEEIREFIKLAQPASMKGIVSSSTNYVDPLYYFGRICGASQPPKLLQFSAKLADGANRSFIPNSNFGHGESAKLDKERKRKASFGVSSDRVTAIRRLKSGAKISEMDSG